MHMVIVVMLLSLVMMMMVMMMILYIDKAVPVTGTASYRDDYGSWDKKANHRMWQNRIGRKEESEEEIDLKESD